MKTPHNKEAALLRLVYSRNGVTARDAAKAFDLHPKRAGRLLTMLVNDGKVAKTMSGGSYPTAIYWPVTA
jgi:predicted ArsR family transcriptional regulator